jgi:outer membrane protein assembly factor BamB
MKRGFSLLFGLCLLFSLGQIASAGTSLDEAPPEKMIIDSPPQPPVGFEAERAPVNLPLTNRASGIVTLAVPAYDWVFGCSAVSGAMIAAYYDRNGFPEIYTGPTNGGVMPLDSSVWPTWSDGTDTYPNNPLVATHDGLDGRSTRGSIDDYWIQYGNQDADPYIANGWTEHAWGAAIGDFMKTSQSTYGNSDGATTFYYSYDPGGLSCSDLEPGGESKYDGAYGIKQFYEARGYLVTDCYTQQTDNKGGGFTFAKFMAEIDAGRPVLLHLAGHSIVGVGYDLSNNTIYINDTWDYSTHSMTWGGSYAGMELQLASIVHIMVPQPPGAFTKSTPENGAGDQPISLNLTWTASTAASLYEICYDTTNDSACSPWIRTSGPTTSARLNDLTNGATYYWQVRAVNAIDTIYADGSEGDYWSFTVSDDDQAPTVSWVKPVTDGNRYDVSNESVQLEATATDNEEIDSVHFYRWDAVNEVYLEIAADTTAPYQATIDARILNYEWNQVDAISVDAAGNRSSRSYIWVYRNYTPPCPDCGLAASAWPVYRQNLQHTGQSKLNGPAQPHTQWSYSTGTYEGSAPAVAADGTIYAGLSTSLIAFNPDGSIQWAFPAGDNVKSPLVGSDGTIYAGSSDGMLYAIQPNGVLKWTFSTGSWIQAAPAIAEDGTLYIGSSDGFFYAINPDGSRKWEYQVGSWVIPSAALDGGGVIYFGSSTGSVYAMNHDGSLRWSYQTGDYVDSSPAILPDGTLLIGSNSTKLYALTPNGALKWSYTTGGVINASPAISADGSIYIGSEDYKLYALDSSGNLKWSYLTGGVVSSAAIGWDGTVYAGSNDGYLYALNPDGSLKWKHAIGSGSYGPVIGADGVIYINAYGDLFAIENQEALLAPTNLAASAVSQTQINLTWQDNSADETAFRLERSLDGASGWVDIAYLDANTTTFSDMEATCGTTYYYRVRAYRGSDASFSAYSNISYTTTAPCAFGKLFPTNGAAGISTSPLLSWEESAGATGYEYCIAKTNVSACSPWTSSGTAVSVNLSGLSNSTSYYWHVRAVNSAGVVYAESSSTAFWSFKTAGPYRTFLPFARK